MYKIIDNEAGNIIEHAETLEQAQKIVEEYEAADKKDGTYTPDFYSIKEKKTRWSAKKIHAFIEQEGGFDNWQHWSHRDIADWIVACFGCSRKLAELVAYRYE